MEQAPARGRPRWWLEVPLLVLGYGLFALTRAAVDRGEMAATANAHALLRVEESLGIAVERSFNATALDHDWLMLLTGYYYKTVLVLVPLTLVLLLVRYPDRYRPLRTVLVAVTVIDIVLVWAFPMSPPRFAMPDMVDYIAALDILGGAQAAQPRSGVNLYAAMPSMHVAWSTWVALAWWSTLRHRPGGGRSAWLARLGWVLPVATALTVLFTANHYVFDAVAGAALTLTVSVLVSRRRSWRMTRTSPAREG